MPRFIKAIAVPGTLLLALGLQACSPLSLVNVLVPADSYRSQTDIAYGSDPRQKLDIYRPAGGRPSKAVIVFLYGGSWKSGERADYRFVGEAFASRGYTVVIPDYRLYPEVRFPVFVEDAAKAVAWVSRNGIADEDDPKPIVLMGHSAGAHIAALLALDQSYLDAAGAPGHLIDGWVGLAGPYAFDPSEYPNTRPIFATASDPDQTRPTRFATEAAPPTLLLHGTEDETVFPKNSQDLARKLQGLGVDARYGALPDVGHTGILLALARPFQDPALVLEPTEAFIDSLATGDHKRSNATVNRANPL